MTLCLQNAPLMGGPFRELRYGCSQSKFKRHIEPGHQKSADSRCLHSRQIVERERTTRNEFGQSTQTNVSRWNLKDALWIQAEACKPGDEGEEKPFVFVVEGDVDEGAAEWSRGRHGLTAAFGGNSARAGFPPTHARASTLA